MIQILTDEEVLQSIGNTADIGGSVRIARTIEQAILNKLSEQYPVAWFDEKLGCFDEKHFDQLKPLYLHPAPSVPEGYQLVPIEPTKAMMWALYGHWVGQLTHLDYGYYKAMLSAARSE